MVLRHLIFISFIIASMLIFLSSCSTNTDEKKYHVVVVEGKESLFKTFDPHANYKNPIIKIDYYKKLKTARKQFADYKIENPPVVFVFADHKGESKKLELHTHDIEESLKFLKSIKKNDSK